MAKAGEGPLDAASIAAPVMAAIAPPERMRKAIVSSRFSSRAANHAFFV
jgi:hypothetical protein